MRPQVAAAGLLLLAACAGAPALSPLPRAFRIETARKLSVTQEFVSAERTTRLESDLDARIELRFEDFDSSGATRRAVVHLLAGSIRAGRRMAPADRIETSASPAPFAADVTWTDGRADVGAVRGGSPTPDDLRLFQGIDLDALGGADALRTAPLDSGAAWTMSRSDVESRLARLGSGRARLVSLEGGITYKVEAADDAAATVSISGEVRATIDVTSQKETSLFTGRFTIHSVIRGTMKVDRKLRLSLEHAEETVTSLSGASGGATLKQTTTETTTSKIVP